MTFLALPSPFWLRADTMPDWALCFDDTNRFYGWVMQSVNNRWVSARKLTPEDLAFLKEEASAEPFLLAILQLEEKLKEKVGG